MDRPPSNRAKGRAALLTVIMAFLLLLPILAAPAGGGPFRDGTIDQDPLVIPPEFNGHRPMVEFFTGLSCPSCMSGPHPETEEMYADMREDDSVPWNYVVFHELNGGGVDGLANDETRERMRHYQPGVSGTPCIEVDGGWHTLGGMLGRDSISPANLQDAIDSADSRFERQINPLRPLQSLRNDFKFVNLEVTQNIQGNEWVVMVKVNYLGMDRLVLQEDLRGSLYVFMVEDDVTAYSTVEEAMVLNHNVFRGYAIKDFQFTMSSGDEELFVGEWPIPEITFDPNEEYPDGTPVPIKTMDMTAVAVVYDVDDTTSGDSGNGNPTAVPRAIQSQTARGTAYDLDNIAEPVGDVTVTMEDVTLAFEALIDDPDGVAAAAVHFTTEGADSTNWTALELFVSGDEVCDDEGVCYAYSNAVAAASIDLDEPVDDVWYVVTYSDGLGAMGRTEVLYTEVNAAVAAGGDVSVSGGIIVAGIMVVLLVALGVLLYMKREDPNQRTAIAAVMVLVLIIGGVFAMSSGGSGGEEAPDIAFTDIDGNSMSLGDYQGKVVLLDMMATWCPSCREGMAALGEISDKYGNSIEMITVDIDLTETSAQLRDFKKEYSADWRFTMDNEDQDFLTNFDVKQIPKIVVIDIYGDVVFAESAVHTADELSEVIDEAMTGGRSAISISAAGGSMGALILWAGALGVLTFFSPCAWPLLPGYMTYYMGLKESSNRRKALLGGMAAASGIVLLFLFVAILVGLFGYAISQYIVYLEPIVGVLLIFMAFLIILDISINFGLLTWPVKKGMAFSKRMMDKLRGKTDAEPEETLVKNIEEGGYAGLFFYGVGYGAAAAGCMAPVVIALIILAISQGSMAGSIVIFMAFALTMAIMMIVITLILGHYGGTASTKFREKFNITPQHVKVFTFLVLFVVGVYLIGYWVSGLA